VLGRTVARGLSLPAQPIRGYSPQHGNSARAGRDRGAVTARGAYVVAHWLADQWCSASDEVLSMSTGGLRGGAEQGEAERGSSVQWGDDEAACSGGSAAGSSGWR
jgi:hypothetical protein